MTENLLNSARNHQPVWKRKLKRTGRALQIWLRELIYSLIEIAILFVVTAVLVGILLSSLQALWYLYLETPVGIKFTAHPSRLSPHLVTQLFKRDLFLFSIEIATATMTACLIMSSAFQIPALHRYFYLGRGLLNRVIILSLFSAAGTFKLSYTGQIEPLVAFGITIVPSLCLFPSCMNISARILPELTPLRIIKIIIKTKNSLIHSDDRVQPEPQVTLGPTSSGNSKRPPALKPIPLAKDRATVRVKPDVRGAAQ